MDTYFQGNTIQPRISRGIKRIVEHYSAKNKEGATAKERERLQVSG